MKHKKKLLLGLGLIILLVFGTNRLKRVNFNTKITVGQVIDSLHGVYVYFNGGVDHVEGRNRTADGYNLGLKYQCVEFVKRYYYEHYQHKMPDTYGHAKDFFDKKIEDGKINKLRNLVQYHNPSILKPKEGDLLVWKGSLYNSYGHVAIVSEVKDTEIEIIQQNPGPFGTSRKMILLENNNGMWFLKEDAILGWLRKEQ